MREGRSATGPDVRPCPAAVMAVAAVMLAGLGPAAPTASGQIAVSGVMGITAASGGSDSAPFVNGLDDEHLNIAVSDLYLFADALVSAGISVNAAFASRSFGGTPVGTPEVLFASVTFWDLAGEHLNLEVGRLVSPLGTYPRRQFPDRDALIGEPLAYGRAVNVSKYTGIAEASGTLYDSTGTVATLYHKRYVSGLRGFGTFWDGKLEWDLGISANPPAASVPLGSNSDGGLALFGRLGVRPVMWLEAGVSYSSGAYLQASPLNDGIDLADFSQDTLVLDLTLDYHYLRLIVEMVSNEWWSPYPPGFPAVTIDRFSLNNDVLLVEGRWDIPALPGLYMAGRYEQMTFKPIFTDFSTWTGPKAPWDDDETRTQFGVGWKPSPRTTLTLSHTLNRTDTDPDPDDDVSALRLVVVF